MGLRFSLTAAVAAATIIVVFVKNRLGCKTLSFERMMRGVLINFSNGHLELELSSSSALLLFNICLLDLCAESVLKSLTLKNYAGCTHQIPKWTSGARVMIILKTYILSLKQLSNRIVSLFQGRLFHVSSSWTWVSRS